jgi:mannose-6-phosphate isomerase-like protein (cupin superfamily)
VIAVTPVRATLLCDTINAEQPMDHTAQNAREAQEGEPMTQLPTAPIVVDLTALAPVPCPCGEARRGLMHPDNQLCSLHRVTISANAQVHYHKRQTEVYYFLEGDGQIELGGEQQPVRPGMAVLIPPGVRHRAVVKPGGEMTLLNFVMPPFDAEDEWFE